MSERENSSRPFAQLMADLAADVAPHVREQNPADARRRGRTRMVRHRTAASLLSLALVGGTAGIAATMSHHGARPIGVDGGPVGTPPAPTTLPRTGTPTSTAPSQKPTSAPGSSATIPVPGTDNHSAAPDIVNAAAWLTPSQLPFAAQLHWETSGSRHIDVMNAAEQDLGACLNGDPQAFGALGTWQTLSESVITSGNVAQEQAYNAQMFFPTTAAARQGLAAMKSAYGSCLGKKASSPYVYNTQNTASDGAGFAMLETFRNQDGTWPAASLAQDDSHEYFVQDGTVVYFLGVYGRAEIDGTGQDPQILQAMHAALQHYPK